VRLGVIAAAVTLAVAVGAGAEAVRAAVPGTPVPAAKKKKKKAPQKKKVPRFVFTFEGRGFGHGIGMSQYGAYGAALAGQSAQQIIARYYQGTTLATLPVTPVRVLLATSAPTLRLSASGAWNVTPEGVPLAAATALPPATEVSVTRLGPAGITVSDAEGTELFRSTGPAIFAPADPLSVVAFKGVRYRGSLRVFVEAGGLSVVNHVDLEQYLLGVVPREMPSKWGDDAPEALAAQAIAARSYAMATRRTGGSFDMYADERSQVYGGVNAEDPRTTQAVAETAGKVVTLNGRIVTTFFFSTSGGRTENVENVFRLGPQSYLISVDDERFDATSPHHVWKDPRTFTDAQLARLLGTKRPVLSMKILETGVSPRVKQIRIVTRTGGVKVMRGTDVRKALGLRDTWFVPKRKIRTPATLRLVSSLPAGS
jgi:stage II sporulation protein D